MPSRSYLFILLSPLIVLMLGCSGEEAKLPVSGTVMLNGKPLPNVNVMMIRADGMNTVLTTDANGRFSSGGEGETLGVPAGTYKVGIAANTEMDISAVAGTTPPPKVPFAQKYMSQTLLG